MSKFVRTRLWPLLLLAALAPASVAAGDPSVLRKPDRPTADTDSLRNLDSRAEDAAARAARRKQDVEKLKREEPPAQDRSAVPAYEDELNRAQQDLDAASRAATQSGREADRAAESAKRRARDKAIQDRRDVRRERIERQRQDERDSRRR